MKATVITIENMESEFMDHYQNLLKNPRFDNDLLQESFLDFYPQLRRFITERRMINPFAYFKVVYERNRKIITIRTDAISGVTSHTPSTGAAIMLPVMRVKPVTRQGGKIILTIYFNCMRAKLIIAGWLLSLLLTAYTGTDLMIWAGIISLMGAMTYLMNRYWREVALEVLKTERFAMRAAFRFNEFLNKCING